MINITRISRIERKQAKCKHVIKKKNVEDKVIEYCMCCNKIFGVEIKK